MRLLWPPPATTMSYSALKWVPPSHGTHLVRRSRVDHRPRARRRHGALAAVRHAAARDAGDPLPRPRRREGVHAAVEDDLPGGARRALPEGALPGLRLEDDRLPLLRVATVSPGRRAGTHRGGLRRAPRLREFRPVHRAAEGGAALHEHAR